MNAAEAAALLTIAASFDNRKPDEDAARGWAYALEDVRFVDAREAVVKHYRRSSQWLMPVDVIKAVTAIRADRIAKAPHPIPPAGLTESEERAWIGDARRRIADGEPPEQFVRHLGPQRPMRALVQQAGASLPEESRADLRERLRRQRAAQKAEPTCAPAPRLMEPEPSKAARAALRPSAASEIGEESA